MDLKKPSISWLGIALVLIGAALLLIRLHVLDLKFATVFWGVVSLFGLLSVARGFAANYRWKIFWGTLWFLYGVFFCLNSTDLIDMHGRMFMPATFMIFGIAFLMMFFNDVHEWLFLIPGLAFGIAGVLFVFAELEYISRYEIYDAIHMYWPIILIALGLGFILRRKNSSASQQPVS